MRRGGGRRGRRGRRTGERIEGGGAPATSGGAWGGLLGAGSFDQLELGLGTGVAFGCATDEVGDDGLGRLFDGLKLLGGEPGHAFGLVEGNDAEAGFIGPDGGDGEFQGG